jgi:hypothetical protein
MLQFWFSLMLYVMVFATGAAGLIFQVTWQKYLSRLHRMFFCHQNAPFMEVVMGGYCFCQEFFPR